MATKIKIRKGDSVQVLTGKDAGKRGTVLRVVPDERRLVVEKLNMVKRHTKPRSQNQKGGIIEKEAPIHWSNVLPVCEHCKKGVRVGYRVGGDGQKERLCRGCGRPIARATGS